MSNRIDPMNQGTLGKIAGKTSDAASTTKITTDPAEARKNVAGQLSSGETVNLTSSAKLLERLEKIVASHSGIDVSRVEAVKTAIANGDYEIDAEKIADALLRTDQEFGDR